MPPGRSSPPQGFTPTPTLAGPGTTGRMDAPGSGGGRGSGGGSGSAGGRGSNGGSGPAVMGGAVSPAVLSQGWKQSPFEISSEIAVHAAERGAANGADALAHSASENLPPPSPTLSPAGTPNHQVWMERRVRIKFLCA